MKQLSSVVTILIFINMIISAEGQQEYSSVVQQEFSSEERTPIRNSQVSEKTLTGILIVENDFIFLVEDSGKTYSVNPRPRMQEEKSMGGGPAPGNKKGQRSKGERPAPPDKAPDFTQYHGLEAVVHGQVLIAPPEDSPFGDIDGIIFPDSLTIDGKNISF